HRGELIVMGAAHVRLHSARNPSNQHSASAFHALQVWLGETPTPAFAVLTFNQSLSLSFSWNQNARSASGLPAGLTRTGTAFSIHPNCDAENYIRWTTCLGAAM